jgi:hypothetical protein
MFVRKFVLKTTNPLENGLKMLPFLYTFTILISICGIMQSVPILLTHYRPAWFHKLIILVALSILIYYGINFFLVSFLRKKLEIQLYKYKINNFSDSIANEQNSKAIQVDYTNEFSYLKSIKVNRSKRENKVKRTARHNSLPESTIKLSLNGQSKKSYFFSSDHNYHSRKSLVGKKISNLKEANELNNNLIINQLEHSNLVDSQYNKTNYYNSYLDSIEIRKIFSLLQILTAIFG